MKKLFTLLLLALQGIISGAQSCGPLDLSFGIGGKTVGISAISNSPDSRNIIIQPDNKIVQVVNTYTGSYYEFGVLRYKSEGQLDSSFGTNGRVTTTVGTGGGYSYSSAGALQTDEKIVVVGTASFSGYSTGFAIVRYNSNGSLDNSFGSGGKVITQIGSNYAIATALSIQSDGKIVVVGKSVDDYYTGAFAVVRYNSNGSIDSTFGVNGKIVTHLGPFITFIGDQYYGRYADESAIAVIPQADGKIVVAGQSYSSEGCWDYYGGIYCNSAFAMIRYNSNGSIDNSFGTNGKVVDSSVLLWVTSMVSQVDGKIVVTGTGNPNAFITKRYNSDGNIDNSFGNAGTVITRIAGSNIYHASNSVALRSDGSIVLAGTLVVNNNSQFAVLRYTSNGIPDSSFNGNGTVFFKIGQPGSYDGATGVALQGNHVVAGGSSRDNNNGSVVVVRLLDSGQLITPVIRASGPLSFCEGGTVRLSSSERGTHQWYRNSLAISGATDTFYVASISGSYTVLANNSSGCGTSSPVGVTVTSPFTPSITANGSVGLCLGDSVFLNSNSYGGNQWYKDGVAINGATASTLIVKTAGNYTARVTVNGCESVASNAIAITVNNTIPDPPSITAGGDITFCSGSSVLLTSSVISGNQWYVNGQPINGSTAATLIVSSSGTFSARVIAIGCRSAASNEIVVSVKDGPGKPPIIWNNAYYFSTTSGYAHYQWLLDGLPIAGVDSNIYKPVQTGLYKVTVIDAAGCRNTSDNFNLVILAVADITVGDAKLHYYPNPSSSILNVDVSGLHNNKLQVELYDLAGRLLHKQMLNQSHNELPVHRLPSGLYQLVINSGTEKTAVKVMVIK